MELESKLVEALRSVFHSIDQNKDGRINKADLQASGCKTTDEEFQDLFKSLGSDDVSFSEFCRGLLKVPHLIPAFQDNYLSTGSSPKNESSSEYMPTLYSALHSFQLALFGKSFPSSLTEGIELIDHLKEIIDLFKTKVNSLTQSAVSHAAEGCYLIVSVLPELLHSQMDELSKLRLSLQELEQKNWFMHEYTEKLEASNKRQFKQIQEFESLKSQHEEKECQMASQIAQLSSQLTIFQEKVESNEAKINNLRQKSDDKSKEIRNLRSTLSSKKSWIVNELDEKTTQDYNLKVQLMGSQIEAKNQVIKELEQTVSRLTFLYEDCSQKLTKAKNRNHQLYFDMKSPRISQFLEVADSNDRVDSLQSEIDLAEIENSIHIGNLRPAAFSIDLRPTRRTQKCCILF